MSDYQEYLAEKEKIDTFVNLGYQLTSVTENLSGAFLEFELKNEMNESKWEQLHIKTADARKYFSTLLNMQKATK
ncbi:hypothetical protein [Bacillus sp. 03113]|uniref:hypothetical protein n=1 Tax=Bacillus sp. 03113 TaxID=2578211 RepID=UPI001141D7DA|nr:hypothetical protein [Bacillus sp. 03113]